MRAIVEAQLHAAVQQTFALHARAGADLDQQTRRTVLEHAGADAALDVSHCTRLPSLQSFSRL